MTRGQYTVNDIRTQPPLRKVTPMTDRIDHAAEAQKVLAMPTSGWGSPSEMLAGAQVNATLAIDVHYIDGHSERWDAEAERNTTCSPWAHHGPIWHMVFANPRPLACPIPARGQVGLWTLPDDIEQAVRRQL